MPAFCQHCYELPGELKGKPSGSEIEIGGVPSYVSTPQSGKGTILLATDIFGLGISNAKIVADVLAQESGFTVVVPDYFEGEPMKPEVSEARISTRVFPTLQPLTNAFECIQRAASLLQEFVFPKHTDEGTPSDEQMGANMQNMTQWVQKGHSPNETYPILKKVIEAVKGDGPVGVVGFCVSTKTTVSSRLLH